MYKTVDFYKAFNTVRPCSAKDFVKVNCMIPINGFTKLIGIGIIQLTFTKSFTLYSAKSQYYYTLCRFETGRLKLSSSLYASLVVVMLSPEACSSHDEDVEDCPARPLGENRQRNKYNFNVM